MDCEICGQTRATTKARIDNVIFSVCGECAKAGTMLEEKPHIEKKPFYKQDYSEEMVVQNYNKLIQQARSRMGLRQQELADRINEKLSVVQAVESGKREPDLKLARKLENFLKIKLVEEV